MAEFTLRERRADAPLPWDHMDTRVSRAFFESEYEKAMTEASTPDCRFDACGGCGVCDFDRIMPRIHAPDHAGPEEAPLPKEQDPSAYAGARIGFSKTGPARFFGHLEMVNIFLRAIHRAGLKIKFSEGFHPMPKIAFSDTLPVGMESMDEHFTVFFDAQTPLAQVPKALNRQLPEGLMIKDCRVSGAKPKSGGRRKETYLITRAEGTFKKALFKKFTDAPRWLLKKTTKKGAEKTIDLKSVVADVQMTRPDQLKLTLRNSPDATVRPHAVLGEVFGLSDDAVRRASIIKLFQDAG
jgi:radical SAM-linked protein